jgi:hypothetical protein
MALGDAADDLLGVASAYRSQRRLSDTPAGQDRTARVRPWGGLGAPNDEALPLLLTV